MLFMGIPRIWKICKLIFGIISIPLMGYLANQISADQLTVYLTLFFTILISF